MSSQSLLGLPPISAGLKPISPFLQRANELRTQDPVIAYWCAYHAAQLGISLKAKDSASRDFLFALLGFLERLKKEIGPTDALDIESVSSAYVENFALKVFAMADNEDRSGSATRSTAKKFLAAAHFLEVLKIFPKAELSESTEEKIKYAKWKAADIAKAFREGRKPAAGPADSGINEDLEATPPASPRSHTVDMPAIVHESPRASSNGLGTKQSQPTTRDDVSPLTEQPHTPQRFTGAHLDVRSYGLGGGALGGGEGEATPGSWSTAATPGAEKIYLDDWKGQPSPTRDTSSVRPEIVNSSGKSETKAIRQAWVSEELEGKDEAGYDSLSASDAASDESSKKVHFTPSELSAAISSAPSSPTYGEHTNNVRAESNWPSEGLTDTSRGVEIQLEHPPSQSIALPPGFVPIAHPSWPMDVSGPQSGHILIPPSSVNPSYGGHEPLASHPNTRESSAFSLHPQRNYSPSPPPVTFELTPSIIAKAQKHCRFAISSLDYDDAEQARKELRTALAILGD